MASVEPLEVAPLLVLQVDDVFPSAVSNVRWTNKIYGIDGLHLRWTFWIPPRKCCTSPQRPWSFRRRRRRDSTSIAKSPGLGKWNSDGAAVTRRGERLLAVRRLPVTAELRGGGWWLLLLLSL